VIDTEADVTPFQGEALDPNNLGIEISGREKGRLTSIKSENNKTVVQNLLQNQPLKENPWGLSPEQIPLGHSGSINSDADENRDGFMIHFSIANQNLNPESNQHKNIHQLVEYNQKIQKKKTKPPDHIAISLASNIH
jgi:hypothetical protein